MFWSCTLSVSLCAGFCLSGAQSVAVCSCSLTLQCVLARCPKGAYHHINSIAVYAICLLCVWLPVCLYQSGGFRLLSILLMGRPAISSHRRCVRLTLALSQMHGVVGGHHLAGHMVLPLIHLPISLFSPSPFLPSLFSLPLFDPLLSCSLALLCSCSALLCSFSLKLSGSEVWCERKRR